CFDLFQKSANRKYSGQLWKIEPMGDGYNRLRNSFTGSRKCLDIVNDGRNNKLRMADCGNYSGQFWEFEP
ncbi:MAG: hypothetical protein WCQ26_05690, partial [Pseudanabaena sp. ELA748]